LVCFKSGLPVGIKAQDGKVYLLTGEPGYSVNAELADYAAKIVTIKGKESIRNGFASAAGRRDSEILKKSRLDCEASDEC
jgi:hypothetical protein